ncbi:ribonuclease H-like domain-containing protein [Tanacetum coccineum]
MTANQIADILTKGLDTVQHLELVKILGRCEAKYRALASVTSELIWILKNLKDLQIENLLPVSLHCDSNSAIKIDTNPVFHERTKHLEIDLHFVRENVLKCVVKIVKVDSANQIADILTKGLDTVQHLELVKILVNSRITMALEILVPEQRIVSFDLSGCDSESKSYMIEQVFIRMSVKDIVRCMIVCKSWGRFIGDPGFRRAYENMSGILITKDKSKIFSFAKNIFDILDQVPDEVDTHQVPEFDNVDTPAPRPSARVPEQRIVSFDLSGCDSESKSYIIEQVFIRMSVKDIVRCMIVCKSWGRFIGDVGFRRAYKNMYDILITKDKCKIFSFAKNIFDILDQVPDEVDTHQVREFDKVDTPAPRPSARVPEQRIVSFDLSGCDSESKSYIIEQVFIRISVKDIVRCIIVCKSWGRFIGDPGFRRAYENMSGILITKDKRINTQKMGAYWRPLYVQSLVSPRVNRTLNKKECQRCERLKDTKDCWFNNKWNKVAHLLGSTQEDYEAVKECYKEYIGMVKIYYEGAQRSKQGRPGEDMVGNSSGTAWIKEP